MAVDSVDKRRSAIGMLPFVVAPVPDGTLDANDRMQATWLYSGIDPSTPTAPAVVLITRSRLLIMSLPEDILCP